MKVYNGVLDIFAEQGIGPETMVYIDDPSLKMSPYDRMVMFSKKKDYFITIINKEGKEVYSGTWTFSREKSSLNRMSTPVEIDSKEWIKMCRAHYKVILEDHTKELNLDNAIIKSFLDTDLYKLTMGQFAYHYEGRKNSTYALKIRSKHDLKIIKERLEEQIKLLKVLRFKEDEIQYLSSLEVNGIKIFKGDYLNYLRYFNLGSVFFEVKDNGDNLELRFSGSWDVAILLEVPLLAIISELFFENNYDLEDGREELNNKIKLLKESNTKISFVDMGTRRRLSHDWQKEVMSTFKNELSDQIKGTSNVLLAKELGMIPIGTMAHEFFQAFQVLGTSIETSQKEALYAWKKEYGEILSVALTDIFGTDVFLHDCDKDLTEKYNGYRHDSGDPINWGYRMLAHFHEMGIDAKSKTLVFSDGLNFEKALKIQKEFEGKINIIFGIGTFLTNDFKNHKALSIVIKLVEMNNKHTIKVSDEPAKVTCESKELVEYTLNWIKKVKKYPTIKVATDLVITNGKNEVLLIQRGDKNEREYKSWALPGGYLDYLELSSEGAVRELEEELGISIKADKIKFECVRDEINRDPSGRTISIVYSYNVGSEKIKIKKNDNEVLNYKWILLNKLPQKMAFDHGEIIKEVCHD